MIAKIAFYSITLVIACTLIYIVAHELTHYALLGKANGICFGNCNVGEDTRAFGAIYTKGPYEKKQTREDIPIAVGLSSAIGFGLIGFFIAKGSD